MTARVLKGLFTANFQAYVDAACSKDKLSHRALATRMSMNRGAFSELYHGVNRDPRVSTCQRICEALGLPLQALVAHTGEARKMYTDMIWNRAPRTAAKR